ncbi:ATP-dependent nuclease [Elizabethkingia anophelis]|uniref:ATP-dependent nuclease n=1 Tax=Elizabethkingia anophelis TaxID=1117645 RepID=UPI0037870690
MKIKKIAVQNFRLLKDFTIDLEDELSLVIGKNNTGKTSILSVLHKFLSSSDRNKFSFEDLNIETKKELKRIISLDAPIDENSFEEIGIKLQLHIEYNEADDLSNISKVMMDLDPDNNIVILGFEYIVNYDRYLDARKDYQAFDAKEKVKEQKAKDIKKVYAVKSLHDFLKQNFDKYFISRKKSFEFDIASGLPNYSNFINLDDEGIGIKEIINFKYINAKRDVTNKDVDKTLSGQTSRIYKTTETSDEQNEAVEDFKDRLTETDDHLTGIYKSLFNGIIDKVKTFGGIRTNESAIEIISTLQHRELLEGNTTVVYKHDDDNHLPEHYNGLGYMNLISMIFEIEILIQEFKRERDKKPADINLLFIEEPEAHTHPQMQYVFIKNIKSLLKEGIVRTDGISRPLQYIISTHSSHIVADSNFNDIKYLKKIEPNGVIAKNLKDLEHEYTANGEEQNYRFLKQYLTLNRAELFFADKAIFIEGDTERILLPAMMKKIDQELHDDNPMLSQNISIVEVGAHSHIFEKFINFIGVKKSLIITDLDSYYLKPVYEDGGTTQKLHENGSPIFKEVKCAGNHANVEFTSNESLIFFHQKKKDIAYYKSLGFEWKILRKNRKGNWVSNRKGYLLISYQVEEDSFHARSFEDAFFHLNKDFIIDSANSFPSLTTKWLEKYRNNEIDSFEFSEKGVKKKTGLAIEILLNSATDATNNEFSNWQIPAYIKESLLWLKQD